MIGMGMISKVVSTAVVGTVLMGTSPLVSPPLYVECKGPDTAVEKRACQHVVRNLRDQKINRAISIGSPSVQNSRVATYLTLHIDTVGSGNVDMYFSWNTDQAKQRTAGPKVRRSQTELKANFQSSLNELIDKTDLPLQPIRPVLMKN